MTLKTALTTKQGFLSFRSYSLYLRNFARIQLIALFHRRPKYIEKDAQARAQKVRKKHRKRKRCLSHCRLETCNWTASNAQESECTYKALTKLCAIPTSAETGKPLFKAKCQSARCNCNHSRHICTQFGIASWESPFPQSFLVQQCSKTEFWWKSMSIN